MSDNHQFKFVIGGDVQASNGTYLKRPADDQLLTNCQNAKYSYVLSCRQIGKSSLKNAVANQIREQNIRECRIDLNEIGRSKDPIHFYFGFINKIHQELSLKIDINKWWEEQDKLSLNSKFCNFFSEILLQEIIEPVAIFVDEIDVTLDMDFTDDFFAAIRTMNNERSKKIDFKRLTFVLLGVAIPNDLIRDTNRTPFNIGEEVIIRDFTKEEAKSFKSALKEQYPTECDLLFNKVYDWTNGHPYLTQKLIKSIAESKKLFSENMVDDLVHYIFLNNRDEYNLKFVNDFITKDPNKAKMLKIYSRILNDQSAADDKSSIPVSKLKLSGIVSANNGQLFVRNKIYQNFFDLNWVEKNLPVKFIVDTPLISNALSYIKRTDDDILFDTVLKKHLCFVHAGSQMGKTSLLNSTESRLSEKGITTVRIDFSEICDSVETKQWINNLCTKLKDGLNIEVDVPEWLNRHYGKDQTNALVTFFNSTIVKTIKTRLVVLFDNIDQLLSKNYEKIFFESIHKIYTRIHRSTLNSITFVLFSSIPYNDYDNAPDIQINKIELNLFTRAETTIFERSLEDIYQGQGKQLFDHVYSYTGGHPYLTQRLCLAIVNTNDILQWDKDGIHKIVNTLFLGKNSNRKHKMIIQEQMKLSKIKINRQPEKPEYGNDIILLAGYGVSRYIGYPNVEQLLKATMKRLPKNHKEAVFDLIESTYKEIGGRQRENNSVNFEKLIEKLMWYQEISTSLREDSVIEKELGDQLFYLNTKRFERKLNLALFTCYQTLYHELGMDNLLNTSTDECSNTLDFLEQLSRLNDNTLHIYTTGHDCSYQAFAKMTDRIAFLSHIDHLNNYSDQWYFIQSKKKEQFVPWVYVHRLHGCVSWFANNKNQISEKLQSNNISFQELEKMCIAHITNNEIDKGFTSAFEEFQEHLLSAKALLIWGYSFKDLEVLRAINDSLNYREKPFPIYYINPYIDENNAKHVIKEKLKTAPVRLSNYLIPKQLTFKQQIYKQCLKNTFDFLKETIK